MSIKVRFTTEPPIIRKQNDDSNTSKSSGRYPWGSGTNKNDISVEQAMSEAVKAMTAAGYKGWEIENVIKAMRKG